MTHSFAARSLHMVDVGNSAEVDGAAHTHTRIALLIGNVSKKDTRNESN